MLNQNLANVGTEFTLRYIILNVIVPKLVEESCRDYKSYMNPRYNSCDTKSWRSFTSPGEIKSIEEGRSNGPTPILFPQRGYFYYSLLKWFISTILEHILNHDSNRRNERLK